MANKAYREGGINTADLRGDPLAGYQWAPPQRTDPGMGNMLGFINQMYGQMQQGRQNQLQNVLKAAEMQHLVESDRETQQLAREKAAEEALNAQLARELSQKGEARAQGEYERQPEKEKLARQFELDKASITALPTLSDATRGSLRLLNPDYAQREEAQKVVERDKQLQVTRQALKQADTPKKKKDIITSIPDPDIKTQLLNELEQETGKKGGGIGGPDMSAGGGLLGALWNVPGAMTNVENRLLESGARGLTGQQLNLPTIEYTKPPLAAAGSVLSRIPGNYMRALSAMSAPGAAVAPGIDVLLRMLGQRRTPEPQVVTAP